MRIIPLILIITTAALFGCASTETKAIYGKRTKRITPTVPTFLKNSAETIKRLKKSESEYEKSTVIEIQRRTRNSYIFTALGIIDESYYDFERILQYSTSLKGTIADTLSLTLSTAATVYTAASTKTILSAIDTTVKGTSTAIDKNVFKEKSTQLLNAEMRRQRSKTERLIRERIKADNDTKILKYTLEEARRDLIAYHSAGTVTNALTTLIESTSVQAQEEAKNLNEIKTEKKSIE